MGTGGHYITMLLADWSIATSYDVFRVTLCPPVAVVKRCGIHLLSELSTVIIIMQ